MQGIIEKYNPSQIYSSAKVKPIAFSSKKTLTPNKFANNNHQSATRNQYQLIKDDFNNSRGNFPMKGSNLLSFSRYSNEKYDGQDPTFMDPNKDKQLIIAQKLSKLQDLWSKHNIPSFYSYYFMQILKKKTLPARHQLILKQIKSLQQKKHNYYFKINELLQARENVFAIIVDFVSENFTKKKVHQVLDNYIQFVKNQSHSQGNDTQMLMMNEVDTVIKHIRMYRMLTMKVINSIFEWQKWIKYHDYTEPVQFLYRHQDYFMKISENDTNKIGHNILFQKNPYFLMKKQYQRKPWKILYNQLKCDPKQAEEIGKTLDILTFHTTRLVKYKLIGQFNNSRFNSRDKIIGYNRKVSSIKKKYRSEVKITPNYLQKQHPVFYRDMNPQHQKNLANNQQQKDLDLKKSNQKPSMIIGLNSFRSKPTSSQNKFLKNKIQSLNQTYKKKDLKIQTAINFKIRQKDFDKMKKVDFSNTDRKFFTTPPIENNNTMLVKTRYQKEEQKNLELQYVQLQENEVLEFLQDILSKLKQKNSSKIEYYLRTILSNKESIIIKISNQDTVVALVIGIEERSPNYRQFFTIKQMIKLNQIKTIMDRLMKYLSSFNKYYQLKQKNQIYQLPIQTVPKQVKAHIKLKVIFQNDKKWKKQLDKLSFQNANLFQVYKNRNSQKQYYEKKDDKIIFKYEIYFDKINEVKIVNKNSITESYFKIQADKVVKLNLNNPGILGYKLIFYGIKEIFEVYFPENSDEVLEFDDLTKAVQGQGQQFMSIDILIPTGSTKYEYMSKDEQKILFHEYIKINNKNTIPLSLIRHQSKYLKNNVIIKKPFIMKIFDNIEQIYMFSIKE